MDDQDNVLVDHEGEEVGRVEVDREEVGLSEASEQALLENQVCLIHPIGHLAAEYQDAQLTMADGRSVDLGQTRCEMNTFQSEAAEGLNQVLLAMVHILMPRAQEATKPSLEEGLLCSYAF